MNLLDYPTSYEDLKWKVSNNVHGDGLYKQLIINCVISHLNLRKIKRINGNSELSFLDDIDEEWRNAPDKYFIEISDFIVKNDGKCLFYMNVIYELIKIYNIHNTILPI